MRRLCLSGFRLVAPPFAVHDAHNQDERQQVATFIANLALFQQRVSAMLETSQRQRGKYSEFDQTCHQSRSYQNMMINIHRRRRGQRRIAIVIELTRERVLSKYSTMSKQ